MRGKLKRFEQRLTHVEVHVADVNGAKGGDGDKRVSLEARANGHAPVAVHAEARPGRQCGDAGGGQGGARARPRARQAQRAAEVALSDPARHSQPPMIRVASYNMRKAIGTDRRRRPERTIEVLNELDADVIALQEADRRFGSRASAIPLAMIEAHSDYKPVELDIRAGSIGWHGNALLVRKRVEVLEHHLFHLPSLEPRGAVLADVRLDGDGAALRRHASRSVRPVAAAAGAGDPRPSRTSARASRRRC